VETSVIRRLSCSRVLRLQGAYYLVGGLWPLVHARSFVFVAGPKPDRFQLAVSSALFVSAGASLLLTVREPPSAGARTLGITTALAVAYVDWAHRRDIRPLFRAEGAAELLFAASAMR
jgi:hypothetical protein